MRKNFDIPSKQQGFSLIELMVASTLGLIFSWAIFEVSVDAIALNLNIQKSGNLSDSGRYLTDLMRKETFLAGYYGEVRELSTTAAAMPDACAISQTNLEAGLSFPVNGLDEVGVGGTAAPACVAQAVKNGSDVLILRRANTNFFTGTGGLTGNQYYVQTNSLDNPVIAQGADTASFNLGGTARIRAYHQDIYYLSDNDEFIRARLLGNAYSEEILSEGVEDFQVVYGIDRSGNGIANADGANPAYIEAPSLSEWDDVVSLRVHFVLRTTEEFASTVSKTFSYADYTGASAKTWNDKYRRSLFSGTVPLTNIAMKSFGG